MALNFAPLYPSEVSIVSLPEAASQTFAVGSPVYVSSGYVTACTTGAGVTTSGVYGIAMSPGRNSTSDGDYNTQIYRVKSDTIFVGRSDATTAATDASTPCGLKLDTNWYVDIGDTTNDAVFVEKLDPRDAVGTSGGRYHFTFLNSVIQRNISA